MMAEERIHQLIPDRISLIIFDADGTLRRTLVEGRPCPHTPDEWELMPQVRETLAQIRHLWFAVASNQDQVGSGLLTAEMAERLLADAISAAAGDETAATIRFCPHAPGIICECRKPQPGMLLDIMRSCGVTPEQTLFVGDAETDREAARRAGVTFLWAWDFFGWHELQAESQNIC